MDNVLPLRQSTVLANARRAETSAMTQTLPLYPGSFTRPSTSTSTFTGSPLHSGLPLPRVKSEPSLVDTTVGIVNESVLEDDGDNPLLHPVFPLARRRCTLGMTGDGVFEDYYALPELVENGFFLPEFHICFRYYTTDAVSFQRNFSN